MELQIEKAAKVLKEGGIVIFPTDTAFGIGCRMDDQAAIKRLFILRKRPENQATPVLFDSVETIENYLLAIPQEVKEKLMDKYWPGALTIVLPCKVEKISNLVRGNSNNLGVRIPNNDITLSVIKKAGVGILGPSANFHGESPPYDFKDLNPELISLVDYVLKGECKFKDVSTVIDCSVSPWKIIREGVVKLNL